MADNTSKLYQYQRTSGASGKSEGKASSAIIQPEIYKAYRFKVEIGGIATAAFSQVRGISINVETMPYRTGMDMFNVPVEIPALASYSHITLSKGVIGDYDMIDWIFSCVSDAQKPMSGISRRNLLITALTDKGTDGPSWFVRGAFPVSYRVEDFDALRGELLIEEIELSHMGLSKGSADGK